MKISKSCFYCFARQICSLGNDERGGDVCRNFHKAVEEKITSYNKRKQTLKRSAVR